MSKKRTSERRSKGPASSRRRPKSSKRTSRARRTAPRSTLSRSDAALIARLEKKGLISVGPDFGKPLADDDEILTPGPACPGAVDALIDDRRDP